MALLNVAVALLLLVDIFRFGSVAASNFSGKSYYFKTVNNNEFSVFNRIHLLNHNITDFDVNPHRPQNVKIVTTPNHVPPFLDEEWNYEHQPVNKTNLPSFIKRFYEQRLAEPSNKTETLRLYFNTNINSSSRIIKFNLNSLSADDVVTDAEMYFYWPLQNTSNVYKTSVVLRLYQYEQQFNDTALTENPDLHKLFNVIYISKAQKGWQTFKIKKPIDNWLNNGEPNLGLLLTVSSYDENKLISVYNDTNEGVLRTFALLKIRKNEDSITTTTTNRSLTLHHPTAHVGSCVKRSWYVNFKTMQWQNLILYPENGFEAFQCSGKCSIDDKATGGVINNHVKLRYLASGFKDKICCVPTGYFPFPIMFLDKFGNVVLKTYEQMIVESCGCR